MAHDHIHQHHSHHVHDHGHHVTGNLRFAFFLNLFFTILEIVGGILTNSVAILSDAVHDLGDTIAIGLSWYFENYSKKESTPTYTYGFARFSLVSALLNATILLLGSGFIIVKAIPRLMNPEEVHTTGMIGFAIIGVIANGIAVLRVSKGSSLNQRMVYLHLMEDVLGWIAVLVGSIIIYFTGWLIIDALLSIAIATWVLFNAQKNLRATLKVMLQSTPENIDLGAMERDLLALPRVTEIHDIHTWSLDGNYHVLSLHIVVEDGTEQQQITDVKCKARGIIQKMGISHETIQVDFVSEDCEFEECVNEEV